MTRQTMFICPPPPDEALSLDTLLDLGFGMVTVRRDGQTIWSKVRSTRKMRSVERDARRTPGYWTVEFYGPMQTTTYERRERDTWVLVETREGFA